MSETSETGKPPQSSGLFRSSMLTKLFNFFAEEVGEARCLMDGLGILTPKSYFFGVEPVAAQYLSPGTDNMARGALLTRKLVTVAGTAQAAFMFAAAPGYIAVPVIAGAYILSRIAGIVAGAGVGLAIEIADDPRRFLPPYPPNRN